MGNLFENAKGQVYAELLNDFMFKRVFGSEANKDVLHDRKAIFDISCLCSDSRTFIIEIQRGYQKFFRDRALFYTSYPINEQGRLAKGLHDKENIERKWGWTNCLSTGTTV